MIYIGVDVHRTMCAATVKDADGKALLQRDFANSRRGIEGFVKEIKGTFGDRGPMAAVCEAVGNHWYVLHDTLEEGGIDTKVAHQAKTGAVAQARLNSDKVVSAVLSDLLREGLVHEAYVPDSHYRSLRALARLRTDCVRSGARCGDRMAAIMAKYDGAPPVQGMHGGEVTEWLRSAGVSDADRTAIGGYLEQLALLRRQVGGLDKEMARACTEDEWVGLLTSMPGIGPAIAVTIIAEVVDMRRFSGAEKLVAYAGLAPPRRSGGAGGGTARTGSPWLRHAMVEAARTAVRHDKRMEGIYKRIGMRQGEMKATVAVARHMLEICWHMTVNNEPYRTQDREPAGRSGPGAMDDARPGRPIEHAAARAPYAQPGCRTE